MFFGFLRSGEITVSSDAAYNPAAQLSFKDMCLDSTIEPQLLEVIIKAFKTDPFCPGTQVYLG